MIPAGQRHGGPRQQRYRPDGEQGGAGGQGHRGHAERDREREHHDHGVLHGEDAGSTGRNCQQVAQRAVAGSRDRVAGDHRHGQRHHEDEQQGQRDEAEEDPVPGELADERDAVWPSGVARLYREAQADADDNGKDGDHGQQRLVPPTAEDKPQLRSEEAKPRPSGARAALASYRRRACGARPGRGRPGCNRPGHGPGADEPASEDSVIDLEPLSGECHEKLLQARRDDARARGPRPGPRPVPRRSAPAAARRAARIPRGPI